MSVLLEVDPKVTYPPKLLPWSDYLIAILVTLLASRASAQTCAGDIVRDGRVDGGDLGTLLANWGPVTSSTISQACDLDKSGGIDGVDLGTLLSSWGLCPAIVTSISPAVGSTAGGTLITLAGELLESTTSITIGGAPCTNLSVRSSTLVNAVTPPGLPGQFDVVVTGARGVTTVSEAFTYASTVVPSWATLVEAQPDPAVITDPVLRSAIAASGFAWRVRDSATQLEMLLVPPGTFQMGCIMGSDLFGCTTGERPVHEVTLTSAFYLGRFEVTQAQWQAAMGTNPSYYQGLPNSPSRPVERVSWNTVQTFLVATGFRLPTEAEWEYACRAGTQTPFHSGPGFPNGTTNDNAIQAIAWTLESGCCSGSRPVGGKAANALGFHDMLGNVWEWVSDWFEPYAPGPDVNPTGPSSGSFRMSRGGSFQLTTGDIRSSYRGGDYPNSAVNATGFRAARNP